MDGRREGQKVGGLGPEYEGRTYVGRMVLTKLGSLRRLRLGGIETAQ